MSARVCRCRAGWPTGWPTVGLRGRTGTCSICASRCGCSMRGIGMSGGGGGSGGGRRFLSLRLRLSRPEYDPRGDEDRAARQRDPRRPPGAQTELALPPHHRSARAEEKETETKDGPHDVRPGTEHLVETPAGATNWIGRVRHTESVAPSDVASRWPRPSSAVDCPQWIERTVTGPACVGDSQNRKRVTMGGHAIPPYGTRPGLEPGKRDRLFQVAQTLQFRRRSERHGGGKADQRSVELTIDGLAKWCLRWWREGNVSASATFPIESCTTVRLGSPKTARVVNCGG